MSEIITFPGRGSKANPNSRVVLDFDKPLRKTRGPDRKERTYHHSGLNMRTAAFRNREAIVEATEEDLVRDCCLEIDKAQFKLKRLQARLQTVRAQAEFLAAAEIKLSAAIVAALLSTNREG
jgi:hypothetical protein